MAIMIKAGSTYAPTNNQGLDLTGSDYYGVIDDVRYDKKSKQAFFSVDVYADAATAATRKEHEVDGETVPASNVSVVSRENFNFSGDDFDSEIGNDGLSVPQAYAKSLETLTDWESDE